MNRMIWIDGQLVPRLQATVSVFDHGLLYGDGVFEGIRVYGGRPFLLAEHLQRLDDGARALMLECPYTRQQLEESLGEACRREGEQDGYIRLVITRGVGDLGLNPKLCQRPTVFFILDKIQLYPPSLYEQGVALITASTRRVPVVSLDPRIKTLNYLNNILAKQEALNAGCPEALMLNTEGLVAECTADNIFLASRGELVTPSTIYGALNGITRGVVLELGRQLGLKVREGAVALFEIYTADECFMTGTGAELVPVVKLDGRVIGTGKPGPVTQKLRESFKAFVASQNL